MFLRCAAFRADAFAARFLGGEVGGADTAATPTGGWNRLPRRFSRPQSDDELRAERERLGIIPREQKKLDRAARAIAKRVTARDAVAVEMEITHAREFDQLIADITARNNAVMEGLAMMLMQSLQARIMEELRDEDDAIAMLLMEM
jgi:hypothetical protein